MDWNSTNEGKNWFEFDLVHGGEYFYQDNIDGYEYSWYVLNATSTTITFQFKFNETSKISQQAIDKCNLNFKKPEQFISYQTGKQLAWLPQKNVYLPKQYASI